MIIFSSLEYQINENLVHTGRNEENVVHFMRTLFTDQLSIS
jgi:hypothetical protein